MLRWPEYWVFFLLLEGQLAVPFWVVQGEPALAYVPSSLRGQKRESCWAAWPKLDRSWQMRFKAPP